MRAAVVQIVGLVAFVGSVASMSLAAGGAALGVAAVFVGLAMERG